MTPDNNHEEIKRLLVENQRLLLENNQMLHKMHKTALVSSILRFVWFLIVLGVPIYIYFAYVAPNWDNLKAKVQSFEELMQDSSRFEEFIDTFKSGNQSE